MKRVTQQYCQYYWGKNFKWNRCHHSNRNSVDVRMWEQPFTEISNIERNTEKILIT